MFNHEPESYNCPFCNFIAGNETEYNAKQDIVFEDDETLAFISPKWWVNNPGNVIIIPKKHVEHIYDIDDELLAKVQIVGKKIATAIKKTYACDGVSFRQHNELAGNQDVWHYHLHIFPRWEKDDLYLNYKNKSFVPLENRLEYATKLTNYFKGY
jgi:histidine triad (HIT) family protein